MFFSESLAQITFWKDPKNCFSNIDLVLINLPVCPVMTTVRAAEMPVDRESLMEAAGEEVF